MRRLRNLTVAAVAGFALSACNNDGPLGANPRHQRIAVDVGGPLTSRLVGHNIRFDVTELAFGAGDEVVFTFDNQDPVVRHSLHIEGPGIDAATEILPGPNVQTLTVTFAEPGEYVFYCDTHRTEMNGTISVS